MMKRLALVSTLGLVAALVSTAAVGATTRYEAEAAGNTQLGCTINIPGDTGWWSGTGFVKDLGDNASDFLQFNNVAADVTGDYTLLIGYKTYDTGRKFDLIVNGGSALRLTAPNPPGGVSSMTQTISLVAGSTNTIRLQGIGSWAPDIDYVDVTGSSVVPEPSSLLALAGLLAPAGMLMRRKRA